MSKEINKTNALDILLSAGNECGMLSQKKSDSIDYDIIYCCIPEEERHKYGDSKEEQCLTFMKNNPDIFGELDLSEHFDFSTDDSVLDYIVFVITMRLGLENIAYKGGDILNKLIPNTRKTYDVNFSIARKELYEDVKIILNELGKLFITKGIIDSYDVKENITDTTSGAIKFNKDGHSILGVDVGLHPLGYGITSLKLDYVNINRFTVERSLADKISVICSRKRFRRVKDLYDTYMFISLFSIDGTLLNECLSNRDINYELKPTDTNVILQLRHAYDKLELNRGESKDEKEKPDYDTVYNLVMKFIDGCQDCNNKTWKVGDYVWDY